MHRGLIGAAIVIFALLSGCGGGGGTPAPAEGRDLDFGPVSTRAVGIAQPPVVMGGSAS